MIKKIEAVECDGCGKLIDADKTESYVIINCSIGIGNKHEANIEDGILCGWCFHEGFRFAEDIIKQKHFESIRKNEYNQEELKKNWVSKLFFG